MFDFSSIENEDDYLKINTRNFSITDTKEIQISLILS
jgi:hypothetical protein